MKKLALVAAFATIFSSGVQAAPVVSNITQVGLWLGTNQLVGAVNGDAGQGQVGAYANIRVGGDTVTGLTFTGTMAFDVLPASVQITFDLKDGQRVGVNGSGGTIFQGGTIEVLQQANKGVGAFLPFNTIDAASLGGLPFVVGGDGHLTTCGGEFGQCTAGLVVDDNGYGVLSGLWNGGFVDPTWNNAASAMTLLGNRAGLYLEGQIELIEVAIVPVPAAAWLFGSALIGLVGVGRKRAKI